MINPLFLWAMALIAFCRFTRGYPYFPMDFPLQALLVQFPRIVLGDRPVPARGCEHPQGLLKKGLFENNGD
jgi:hypothetical protein